EEKTETRSEVVDVEAAPSRPLDIFDAIVDGKGQFLQRRRSRFANVITGNGNSVESRRELRSEFEGVNHQPHRGRGRVDVFLLRDVFLENIVLNRAGDLLPVRALF